MIIKNVKVYGEDMKFREGSAVIEEGLFVKERPAADGEEVIDGGGCYAVPGLIDLHFHGCLGHDVCDGTREALDAIAQYEASCGVTAISPATLTLPAEELEDILRNAASYKKETEALPPAERARRADLVGINMEGPFICQAKKGAQNGSYIIPCDAGTAKRFLDASEGLVKFIGLAAEENPDFPDFIREMKDKVGISLAHTNADYDTAKAAFDAGARHAVHLFNAMPPFAHRDPGVVGAAFDSPHVRAELICDGVHIHPSAVRAVFAMFGAERITIISDGLSATGMPDGRYVLGGLKIEVHGKYARLVSNGALAGSVSNLAGCLRTAVKEMGIPLEQAVACVTKNPAEELGVFDRYGSIAPGKNGNVVLLDEDLNVRMVVKDGICL